VEKDFANIWTPHGARAAPNGNYAVTYGDEWKPFGEREKAIVPTATPRIPAIRTQFVMLWLTKVPPDGDGTYTGVVNEITVEGPAT